MKTAVVGDIVSFQDTTWEVTACDGLTVTLFNVVDGTTRVIAAVLLVTDETFTGVGDPVPSLRDQRLLDALSEPKRRAAEFWYDHMYEVRYGIRPSDRALIDPPPPSGTVAQRLERKRQELAAKGLRVSMSTMWRRYQGFKTGVLGCADQRGLPGHVRGGSIDPRVLAVLDQARRRFTWTPTASKAQVIELAAHESARQQLPVLPRSTAYRELAKLDRGRFSFGPATSRQSQATSPDRGWGSSVALYPGQEVQLDSTPLDAWALLADGTKSRVDLAVAIDVATRTIGAAILRPQAAKTVDAVEMVNRAMMPLHRVPGWNDTMTIARAYLPSGALSSPARFDECAARRPLLDIRGVFVDRGRIFVGPTFVRAMEARGIHHRIASPGEPTAKPIVERVFATIGADFVGWMRGYKGNSVANRGRRSTIDAVWPIVLLQALLDEWIVTVYQCRRHAGLEHGLAPQMRVITPNDLYAALSAHMPGQIRVLDLDEWIGLLPLAKRAINRYGINLHHLRYLPRRDTRDEDRLRDLARTRSRRADGRWEIRYDPTNIMQLWVRDDAEHRWLECRWVHADLVVVPFGLDVLHALRAALDSADRPSQKQLAQRANDIHLRLFTGPNCTGAEDNPRAAAAARQNLTRQVMGLRPAAVSTDRGAPSPHRGEPPGQSRIEPIPAVDYSEEW